MSRTLPTRVWAPAARGVELVTPGDGQRVPMSPGAHGWWRGPDLPPGTDYWFSPDGEGPFPDPRSRWQPHGVDGPSRTWTAADHQWVPSPDREVLGGVFYELHVVTFTPGGTLTSAIDGLDDLVDLGVDVVELMPLAQFSGEFGWGYDGVDLFAVHRAYGGPEALVRFVDAAHARGLSVCLDVVLNHLGAWGNHLSRFGPYYTDRHQTPWGPASTWTAPTPTSRGASSWTCAATGWSTCTSTSCAWTRSTRSTTTPTLTFSRSWLDSCPGGRRSRDAH
ncbi:alpha-amylase family glycosyl hydrolase [Actinomyces polynesiensis]|uniref:alpha-amylase family glycosyl hydrolase n=1 Tax=Actinomyces polynesiensis TaxID=1325934 RepID=UPI000694D592|nr:alpha-amylase family glycosyl hydrolase [Actinomyces polynesiensis]